ncbi:hypothetical protein [Haladaptatus sp. DYF46]|nr:hypothetical protein [Haladaptatus sp. DYF46]
MDVFLAKFPGFLDSALTKRSLARGRIIARLVQPKNRRTAESE